MRRDSPWRRSTHQTPLGLMRMPAHRSWASVALFEDARRDRDDVVLRAAGPEGDEIEVAGESEEDAWGPWQSRSRRSVRTVGPVTDGAADDLRPLA